MGLPGEDDFFCWNNVQESQRGKVLLVDLPVSHVEVQEISGGDANPVGSTLPGLRYLYTRGIVVESAYCSAPPSSLASRMHAQLRRAKLLCNPDRIAELQRSGSSVARYRHVFGLMRSGRAWEPKVTHTAGIQEFLLRS